ncbi:MAG: ferritin family protein [Candidatus Omnitrophica bacterium]|nr:ferritin family protein [Candidatus Omnitrophota bacterium]
MGNIFAVSEIVEIGIQIEKNGKDFYNALSNRLDNAKIRDVFKYLAGEEEKHIVVFQKILGGIEKYEPVESFPGENLSYINALASEYIFTKKDKGVEAAKNLKTDKEAVDKGVEFEKDSIVFYEGMKKLIPDYDIKVIEELIKQEQSHLLQLLELKSKL